MHLNGNVGFALTIFGECLIFLLMTNWKTCLQSDGIMPLIFELSFYQNLLHVVSFYNDMGRPMVNITFYNAFIETKKKRKDKKRIIIEYYWSYLICFVD